MSRLSVLLLVLGLFPLFALPLRAAGGPCAADAPCEVRGGFYHAYVPAGWDGRPNLAAMVYFHGWREEAKSVLADAAMREFADRRDVILILPQGAGLTWSFPGSPGQHRDEFAFVEAVIADALMRLPVDPARVVAAGFSQGGSMVWNLACHAPARFMAFLPVAGGFWQPLPEACTPGPRRMFHIHGREDVTVPMAGRALRGGAFRQGDIRAGWEILSRASACGVEAAQLTRRARFACEHRRGCAAPAALELCLYAGGHMMEVEFLDLGLDWVEAEAN